MIDANLRSLLEQYNRHTGRGNMIAANQTIVTMIEMLAERSCQCACGSTTAQSSVLPTKPEPLQYDAEDPLVTQAPIVVKRKVGRPRRVA